jgi:hypothetical protein
MASEVRRRCAPPHQWLRRPSQLNRVFDGLLEERESAWLAEA